MNNLELIKHAYQLFGEGNVPAVLDLFDSKIEWRECKSFPFGPDDGVSIGPNAVLQDVFSQIPAHYEGFNIEVIDIIASGDNVVMYGYYKGIWKKTGKEFKANAAHIWKVTDGKISNFFQAVDSAEIINP